MQVRMPYAPNVGPLWLRLLKAAAVMFVLSASLTVLVLGVPAPDPTVPLLGAVAAVAFGVGAVAAFAYGLHIRRVDPSRRV